MEGMDKKRSFEQELELSIYKLFREKLSEEFDIQVEQRLDSKKRPDIAISKGDKRLAIIEVKPRFYQGESRVDAENQVTELAYSEGFRYAIIAVDEEILLLKDCFLNKNNKFKKFSLEAICHIFEIIRNPDLVPGKEYRDAVFKKLVEMTTNAKDKVIAFKDRNRAATMMRDEESFFFEREDVEDELFECFLKKFEGDKVCRYTSLASLYRTIDEGTQSMCCIVGMNDRSECTYADNYIKDLNVASIPSVKTLYEAGVENRFYILSCMNEQKYDDLTMWRLYGDNTKGVNVLYDVDKNGLTDFKLYNIDYAEQPGKQGHYALNIIGALMGLKVDGRTFKLRRWNEWKHFFKPYEYKDEMEIRLLYNKMNKPASKWILTSDYQIVCPLMIFSVKKFPLLIDKIMLGPNCPDIKVNQLQLELMIKEHIGLLRLSRKYDVVTTRGIGTYRM